MRKFITCAILAIAMATYVGCKAEGELGDDDMSADGDYKRTKTTSVDDDGDRKTTKTEVKVDR